MELQRIFPMVLAATLTTFLRKSRTWFFVITGFFALNSLLRFAAWLWISSSQGSADALAPVFRFVIRTEPDSHFLLLFFFAALLLRESKVKKQP